MSLRSNFVALRFPAECSIAVIFDRLLVLWTPSAKKSTVEGMGLEAVEIVIAVEERFGIEISNAEAMACTTPGQLVDVVMRKLPQGAEGSCASRRGFHLLRSALVEVAGVPRTTIRPDSALALPRDPREHAAFWSRLHETVGARSWPDLVRPRWMVLAIWAATLLAVFAAAVPLWGTEMATPAMLAGATVAGWLLVRITRRYRRRIPRAFATVRALVPFAETAPSVRWTRQEASREVREIVVGILGLKEDRYDEGADFVEELGIG